MNSPILLSWITCPSWQLRKQSHHLSGLEGIQPSTGAPWLPPPGRLDKTRQWWMWPGLCDNGNETCYHCSCSWNRAFEELRPGGQEGLRSVEVHKLGQAQYVQNTFKCVKSKAGHYYKWLQISRFQFWCLIFIFFFLSSVVTCPRQVYSFYVL